MKSRSIRARLIVSLLASLAVLLGAGGAGVYLVTRKVLERDFDRMLRAALPEVAGRVRGFLTERPAGEPAAVLDFRREPPLYFQAWSSDGRLLALAAPLQGAALPYPSPAADRERWLDFTLTNGRPARALIVSVDLRPETRRETLQHYAPGGGGGTGPPVETPESAAAPEAARRPRAAPETAERRANDAAATLVLLVGADRGELSAALQRLSRVLWGAGGLMLALTALLVTVVSHRGLAPLQAVADQASRIDASSLDARFPAGGLPAELQSICSRLNDLLTRLQAAFARERCFSADVAHELRTPIAELRTLAEVALKWPDPDPVVVGAFEDARAIAVQMQRIVTGLLGIARCEAGTQAVASESVRVAELVRKTWHPLQPRASEKGLQVRMDLGDPAPVLTDPALLGVVVGNLLSNAVEYTPSQGRIDVFLRPEGSSFELRVANSADGVTPEDLPRFFDRFWRKDAARSSSEHSGIGLSVSQAYARALGLSLRVSLPSPAWLCVDLRPGDKAGAPGRKPGVREAPGTVPREQADASAPP